MFDMHCHVDLIDSMDKFCSDVVAFNISLLAMTTTPKAYYVERNMLKMFPSVYLALGLHPQLVSERKQELAIFDRDVSSSRFIGEVGLDFSRRFYHSKEDQIYAFEHIIQSCTHSKVISMHSVFSDKQVLDILERNDATRKNTCIFHWYSGSLKQLDRALEMGCFFSINEQMSYSPSGKKIIERIPTSRMLLESDAPFVKGIGSAVDLRESLKRTINGIEAIKANRILDELNLTSSKILGI